MPHKRNPELSERISGIARVIRSNSIVALENIPLWNERDISNSSVERIILPDAFHLISFMTSELNMIISNLVINHDKIKKNLQDAKNKSMSQKFLSHLVNNGIDRDTAYRKIQDQIFKDTPLNKLKENLQVEFNVKFPDFNDDVQKNVDQNKFKDKFQ